MHLLLPLISTSVFMLLFIVVRPTRIKVCAYSGSIWVVNQPKASLLEQLRYIDIRPSPLGLFEDISNASISIKEGGSHITRTFSTPVFGFQHNAKHPDDFLYNMGKAQASYVHTSYSVSTKSSYYCLSSLVNKA